MLGNEIVLTDREAGLLNVYLPVFCGWDLTAHCHMGPKSSKSQHTLEPEKRFK